MAQAGVYPNVFAASRAIIDAAGVRGLFTGYLPTLLEDVPDMAFKFAAYESLRSLHRRANGGRTANAQVCHFMLGRWEWIAHIRYMQLMNGCWTSFNSCRIQWERLISCLLILPTCWRG